MKKFLAMTLCAMMLFSAFAFAVSAEDKVYTTWEELAAYENFPYYNAYINGKTPTIDGEVKADEYTAAIKLDNDDITYNKGGAVEGSIPDFVNIYVHHDADNVYFAVEIQNDKAATAVYKDADEVVGEGWIDWRFSFDVSSATTIERPHYIDGANKYKNMHIRPRLDVEKTDSYCMNGCSFGMFNFTTGAKADNNVIANVAAKNYTHATDMSKCYTTAEWVMPKAELMTEFACDGDKIQYINLGMWVNSIWYAMNAENKWAAVANSRVGWGTTVSAELSMATDFVLPANNVGYDIDDNIICVRISDTKENAPTTPANTTTAADTTPAATTTAKTTTAKTTTAAATTAATTTAATTTTAAPEKGCKGALAISAIALLPALGVAFVASKKKED